MNSVSRTLMVCFFACLMLFGCGRRSSSKVDREHVLPPGVDMGLSGGVDFIEMEGSRKVWSMKCREATYSTEAGILKLNGVKARYYRDGKPIYDVVGRKGSYDGDHRVLNLAGDVEVTSAEGYILRSDSLRYSFREGIAVTDSPVEIEGRGMRMSGVGMEARVRDDVISIKKDVKVSAEPGVLGGGVEGGSD